MSKHIEPTPLNADLNIPVRINTNELPFEPSFFQGMSIKYLERIPSKPHVRVTAIVKMDPNFVSPEHTHDSGDDYLMLEGTYSDENGDFHAGTYKRTPFSRSHVSRTVEGGTFLAKLSWISPSDPNNKVIRKSIVSPLKSSESSMSANDDDWKEVGSNPGDHKRLLLYKCDQTGEQVAIHLIKPNTTITYEVPKNGLECFGLEGHLDVYDLESNNLMYDISPNVWNRHSLNETGKTLKLVTGPEGYKGFVRSGYACF